MSPLWGHLAGIITVLVMLAFIGIWIWAWLPHHKPKFDALAELADAKTEKDRAMSDVLVGAG